MNVHTFNSNDRCYYSRHNVQAAEIAERLPTFLNRSSGVFTGLRLTTGPGLSLKVATGKALVNASLKTVGLSHLSAVNTNFNFVGIGSGGVAAIYTGVSRFPSDNKYAIVGVAQASGGTIIALRDLRSRIGDPWLLAPGQATAYQLKASSDGVFSYDIGASYFGRPTGNQTIMRYLAVRAFALQTGVALSKAGAATAATGSTTLHLRKNGTRFARIVFGAGATLGTFAGTTQSFAAGDKLTITTPTTMDTTLASIYISLAGRKVL